MAIGLFRLIGALGRTMVVANTFGSFALLVVFVLGGFILARRKSSAFLNNDIIFLVFLMLKPEAKVKSMEFDKCFFLFKMLSYCFSC